MTLPRTRRHLRHAVSAALAALITGSTLFVASPAHALDGPVAVADEVIDTTVDGYTELNVLANDTWDSEHDATLVDVQLLSAHRSQYPPASGGPELHPSVDFDADGTVRLIWGPHDSPSLIKEAALTYIFTDSAGQSAVGTAGIRESRDPHDSAVVDDDNASLGQVMEAWATPVRSIGNAGDPIEMHPLYNDRLGPWSHYVYEVVEQPEHGTVAVRSNGLMLWTPPAEAYPERTDTFTYRACYDGACTDPATTSFTTVKAEADAHPVYDLHAHRAFWVGSASEYTFDPTDQARNYNAALDADIESGLTAVSTGGPSLGDLVENSDGTWTYSWSTWPTPTAFNAAWEALTFDLHNGAGTLVATATLDLTFQEPDQTEAGTADLREDVVWATVGQQVPIRPHANDRMPDPVTAGGPYIGGTSQGGVRTLTAPTLGTLVNDSVEPVLAGQVSNSTGAVTTYWFTAGDTPGTTTWEYEVCQPYPVRVGCDTAEVTIHVTPVAEAVNDTAAGALGASTVVDVLSNDSYTDREGLDTAEVTITDVPDGVGAQVKPDRSIEVTVPDAFAGDEVVVGYRLRDYTGTSQAQVTVSVASAPTPDPPVVPDPSTCETDPSLCPVVEPDPTCETDASLCDPEPTCETDPALCDPEPTCETDPSLCDPEPTCETDPTVCVEPDPTGPTIIIACPGPPDAKPDPEPDPGPRAEPPLIHAGAVHPVTAAATTEPAGTSHAALVLGLGALLTGAAGVATSLRRRRATCQR